MGHEVHGSGFRAVGAIALAAALLGASTSPLVAIEPGPSATDDPTLAAIERWTDFAAFGQVYNQSRRLPGRSVAEWVAGADVALRSLPAPPPTVPESAGALIGGYERLARITERQRSIEGGTVEALLRRYLSLTGQVLAAWHLDDFGAEVVEQLEVASRGIGAPIVESFYRAYRERLGGRPDLDAVAVETAKFDGCAPGLSAGALMAVEILVEEYFRELGALRSSPRIVEGGPLAFQEQFRLDASRWNPTIELVVLEALVERGPEGMYALMTAQPGDTTEGQRNYRARLNWDDLTAALDRSLVDTIAECLRVVRGRIFERTAAVLQDLLLGEPFLRSRLTLRRSSGRLTEALYDAGAAAAALPDDPSVADRLEQAIELLSVLDTTSAVYARRRLLAMREPPE